MATDILITVIVYNPPPPPPPRVSCSALALACRWVQNQLFDTRFMMAAKRPVRYTCTIRLVRDRKFGDWRKPLRVRWSSFISAFFLFFIFFIFFFWRREVLEAIDEFNDLQYLASTKGSSSALVDGRSCTCVFYCTSLEAFFLFLFFFFCILWCTLWKL